MNINGILLLKFNKNTPKNRQKQNDNYSKNVIKSDNLDLVSYPKNYYSNRFLFCQNMHLPNDSKEKFGKENHSENKTTVGTRDINEIVFENNKKISKLENKTAIDFFKELNHKSPEKCSVLLNNDVIAKYCNAECGLFGDEFKDSNSAELNILKNAIDKINAEDIKEIINSLSQRKETLYAISVINGIILYSNDKKAFNYVIKSPFVKEDIIYLSGYSKSLCKYILRNLTPDSVNSVRYNSVLEIEKGINDDFDFSPYTLNSDDFINNPDEVEKLHNHLIKRISNDDFILYRGEKSAWIFDSVPISKNLQNQIRTIVFSNPESKNDLIFPNNKQYLGISKQNIYDYISKKEELSLADAMLVAKYAGKEFVDNVINIIKNSSVRCQRFKSFTLSKKYAQFWAHRKKTSTNNNMLAIVTKTNIKKGNQIAYAPKSKQYEFIVNNNLKIMTFSNAEFDKETNTFYIESEISACDS